MLHGLSDRGYRLAVISWTLNVLFDRMFPDHPFCEVYTNRIHFDESDALVSWQTTPFDGVGKPDALRSISQRQEIPLEQSAFIGDGENDVPLLGVAGYFVALRPRSQRLEADADHVIWDDHLGGLLDLFKGNNGLEKDGES